jgi:hypothetical protein
MSDFYEVWDFESRNITNSVPSEALALAFLRSLLDLNGPEGVQEMGIVRQTVNNSGEYQPTLILEGAALLARLHTIESTKQTRASRAAS